jgi:hypothetical protein
MDTFEKMMKAMNDMPQDEVQKTVKELKAMCVCPQCPNYNDCAKKAGEALFCATGRSFMCISDEKGCSCPGCPVTAKLGLKYSFFCTRGSEKAQRYENTLWGATLAKE